MAILEETTGTVHACDGCGRTDAGPSQALHISEYTVHDPNIGGRVLRHYCAGCGAARGSASFEHLNINEPVAVNVVNEDKAASKK